MVGCDVIECRTMAVTAASIDSMWALSLTTDSEFDKYTQSPAKQNKIQSYIAPKVHRDQDSASEIVSQMTPRVLRTSLRVALLASDLASCLRVKVYCTTFNGN